MVSASKIVGQLFQAAGLLVMFYGVLQQAGLFSASQHFATANVRTAALSRGLYSIIAWTVAGILLILIGFGIMTISTRRPGKNREGEPLLFDLSGRRGKL